MLQDSLRGRGAIPLVCSALAVERKTKQNQIFSFAIITCSFRPCLSGGLEEEWRRTGGGWEEEEEEDWRRIGGDLAEKENCRRT